MSMTTSIVLAALGIAGLWVWWTYNRLVRARNLTEASWSDIDVQLQRRHDLVPRLVEAVRAYTGYEQATFKAVTALRDRSRHTQSLVAKATIEKELEIATHRLVALAESYPDLKANRNFLELQKELADTEDHLQYARRFYNGAVRDYNTGLQRFPELLLANFFNFTDREFFIADENAASAVHVNLV